MCSGIRFTDKAGNMFFGRNLDWSFSYGERVVITPAGYQLESPFGAMPKTSHPLIGMGITAQGIPLYFDCANDQGLAVAGLNFPGFAAYEPQAVEGKTNIAAYEFPLWVAGRFASVDEVEENLADVAIVGKAPIEQLGVAQLHWIIADAQRSIVVEHTEAGLQVFRNDVDVLTNQPGFAWHREHLRSYLNVTCEVPPTRTWRQAQLAPYGAGAGMRGIPGDYYSPSRFVRLAYLNANYPEKETEQENVTRLFRSLEGVSMVEGASRMADGDFEITIFTSGFSANTNTYYYATYDNPAIRAVAMGDYDLHGSQLIEIAE